MVTYEIKILSSLDADRLQRRGGSVVKGEYWLAVIPHLYVWLEVFGTKPL